MKIVASQNGFGAPIVIIVMLVILGSIIAVRFNIKTPQDTRAQAYVSSAKKVSGFYVPWDKARGFNTIQNNSDLFSSISPFAYIPDSSGNVIFDPTGGSAVVDSTSLNYFRSKNIKIIPAIHNLINGQWNNGNIVSSIINNPTLAQAHINNIVKIVVENNYDGIDIDYENLNGVSDRQAYTNFITTLANELHARGKVITTDVYGKTSEPGNWSGQQAQDLAALGRVVDEVRFMLYDYNPAIEGPIAPYSWTDSVLAFAKTQMLPEKIMQGIPLYAYDYVGTTYPTDYTHTEARQNIQQYNATVNWDTTNFVSWFTYGINGTTHKVWFEDAKSSGYKFDLTNKHGIGGVYFWRLGGEDPNTWTTLRTKFVTPTPSPSPSLNPTTSPSPSISSVPMTDIMPPSVTITRPIGGAQIYNKTIIQANANDNVKVKQVDFYMDGVFLQSDTTAPYSMSRNTNKLSRGSHIIKVVAKDTSNNSAQHQITVNK